MCAELGLTVGELNDFEERMEVLAREEKYQ